jgi:hypothetical protein
MSGQGFGLMPVKLRWQSPPFAGVCHIHCVEEDDGVSGLGSRRSQIMAQPVVRLRALLSLL